MSSIRKASTKILFLSEVTEVQLTANLLVIILPIAVNYFLTGAMASSFHAAFCTKPYKGVSGTQSYIQDGLNMPSSAKVCKNATFKQVILNFA